MVTSLAGYPPCTRFRRVSAIAVALSMWTFGLRPPPPAAAAEASDITQAYELFKSGEYAKCLELTTEAIKGRHYSETLHLLKIESELAVGRYGDARESLEQSLKYLSSSIRLRWLGHEVYRYNDDPDKAQSMLDQISDLARRSPWRYSDPGSHVTIGRYFLHVGADPKDVLDKIFQPIKDRHPDHLDVYIASGQVALDKHDYALAAEEFQDAAKRDPTDPDVCYGLARAFAPSDSAEAEKWLALALEKNPNHVPSLLLIVDHHVDAERYEDAKQVLDRIELVNAHHPLALAYRAVLAHLENQPQAEQRYRERALRWWSRNPEVDHLIGRKLSQKYRFAEGARCQRQSLAFDADYVPAKIQLSQDLLRLGQEEEGWQLADDVYEQDNYNVVAHNLVTLQESLSQFRTIDSDGFIIRMDAREAQIYGGRVQDLLRRAKDQLCPKYEVTIDQPVIVELFPRQQDFAIRTFGLPGGAGFLGVCFGHVITANSPASQRENPSNWQATLWHEFCHVVTLQKTNNKMPRWLSEGISVYEEKQADPTWGQSMTPEYRAMLLADDLTPVSQLSGAFLNPASPLHLQFAYYESALVVEYLIDRYGVETLRRVLTDLGVGMSINESLARYAGSLELLDAEFAEFARDRARQHAPDVDWEKPELSERPNIKELADWLAEHPNSFWGLQGHAMLLLAQEDWQGAKQPLQRLLDLYPEFTGPNNAYTLLALAHRKLGETEAERAVLERLAVRDHDAVDAYLRLMELCSESADWAATKDYAEKMLAVDPLQKAVHRYRVQACEHTADDAGAIESYESLLLMDPVDPAESHFRLATLQYRGGQWESARRHVLQSLEEAPRYRAALQLLVDIVRAREGENDGNDENKDSSSSGSQEPASEKS